MNTSRPFGLIALFLLVSTSALADTPHERDGGIFFRLAPGVGFSRTKVDTPEASLAFSGGSGNFDVATGYFVSDNLALHVSSGAWAVVEPTVEIDGREFDGDELSLSLIKYGLGLTYYLGTSSVYLTGSVCLAKLEAKLNDDDYESDTGFSAEIGLGKEWWIGRRWAFGVGAMANYHSVPDESGDPFRGTSIAVQLLLTRN